MVSTASSTRIAPASVGSRPGVCSGAAIPSSANSTRSGRSVLAGRPASARRRRRASSATCRITAINSSRTRGSDGRAFGRCASNSVVPFPSRAASRPGAASSHTSASPLSIACCPSVASTSKNRTLAGQFSCSAGESDVKAAATAAMRSARGVASEPLKAIVSCVGAWRSSRSLTAVRTPKAVERAMIG